MTAAKRDDRRMETERQDQREARLAGYRIIRRLGVGSHSDLYLGHADDPTTGEGKTAVVVKVFRPFTDQGLISDQMSVATCIRAGSFAQLIDLATLPDGRVVFVLERITGPALSAVLDTRTQLAPGEAVTILAPIVVALSSLHRAGFAHTTLSQASVRFQSGGRPYLTGLGGVRRLPGFGGRHQEATSHQETAAPTRIDQLRADYGRLAALMRAVFDLLSRADAVTRRAEALLAWFEMAATVVPFESSLEELERRLFAWSPAAPVRLTELPQARAVPARIDPASPGAASPQAALEPALRAAGAAPVPGSRAALWRVVQTLARAIERDPLQQIRARARDVAVARRGPLLVLVCISAAATVLGLTLISPRSTATVQPLPTPGNGMGAPSTRGPGQSNGAIGPASTRTQGSGDVLRPDDRIIGDSIAGDDPVQAAAALLAGRRECLAAASVACLPAFDQAGSAVMEADAYAIEHGTGADALALNLRDVGDLRERTGNLAIVALNATAADAKGGDSEPASLLLVKGEAGWRLREVFE